MLVIQANKTSFDTLRNNTAINILCFLVNEVSIWPFLALWNGYGLHIMPNDYYFSNIVAMHLYFNIATFTKSIYRLNINWFVWIGNNQNISLLIWVVSNIEYKFEFSTACIINSWNCSRKTHSTCLHSRAMCLWLWNCNLQNGSEFIDLQHLQNACSIYRF